MRVELVGGLGNQLNCYFAGLHYAMKYNYSEITLNFGTANQAHIHPKVLKSAIPKTIKYGDGRILKISLLDQPRKARLIGKMRKLGSFGYAVFKFIDGKFEDAHLNHLVASKYHSSCDKILLLLGIWYRRNLVLDGFFHSFRFYNTVKEKVANIETLIEFDKIDFKCIDKNTLIATQEPSHCTIHLRVSDFETIGQYVFGVLSESYYLKAVQLITQKYPTIIFKLLSDNELLAKQLYPNLLKLCDGFYENLDKQSPLESFEILRNSEVVICANSGFSFWGVKLNRNNHMCIIPSKPHVTLIGCRDIPEHWIRIENEFI